MSTDARPPALALLWPVLLIGTLWRAGIAWITPVPAPDGVNYLWMAERLAAGDGCAALSEVFPPGLAACIAPGIALGVEPFAAGQAVLCVLGALAAWPMARAVEAVRPGGGMAAAWCAAFAHLPVRHAGEVLSEPLFLLTLAWALDGALRRQRVQAGLWSAAAFLVRPEAVLLPAVFAVSALRPADGRRWPRAVDLRAGLALVAPTLVVMAALAWLRGRCGLDIDPLPKLAFNWEKGATGEDGPLAFATRTLGQLVELPWLAVEAFALLAPLAIVGAWRTRERPRQAATLGWLLLLACLVIAAFVPRRRFLVSWLPVVLPFAISGLLAFRFRHQTPVMFVVLATFLALGTRTAGPERLVERDLGTWLAADLAPGERVVGDMTRVLYFAGQRPLPPRHLEVTELVRQAEARDVRFVVLGIRRPTAARTAELLGDAFAPWLPSPEVAARLAMRGILVLERR